MSDSFINGLQNEFNNELSTTENGALGYKTTGNPLLDLNFETSSLRSMDEDQIVNKFLKAMSFDKEYALRWMFFARDVRNGLGERRLFRVLLKHIADTYPKETTRILPFIGEIGRFDDLLSLFGSRIENNVLHYIRTQIIEDDENVVRGKSVSLLAKWLPSINASSAETRKNAVKICQYMGLSPKFYRKMLARIRKYIDVVEVKMSSGKWSEIDYSKVPSQSNLKYKDAFLRNDKNRRSKYLEDVFNGEAKINSSVNTPADITYQYTKDMNHGMEVDETIELLWKNMKRFEMTKNILPVVDVSGSMTWYTCNKNTNLRPIDVAVALGIYASELNTGVYKDKLLSFSTEPEFIGLSGLDTLKDKIHRIVHNNNAGYSTDVEAVFEKVLKTAVENNLKNEDIPDIMILSDMEFNIAISGDCDKTLFETIGKKFADAGYRLPRLIFWNIYSRTNTIPLKENESGVALLSGYSTNIMRMVMSNNLDPYMVLKEQLDAEIYTRIYNSFIGK